MFAVFAIMRQLHELLWYLAEALTLPAAAPIRNELGLALEETERLTLGTPEVLVELDLTAHRQEVNVLLQRTSELVRPAGKGIDRRGADLIGANLKGADLRGANMRGAYLIGADLTGADLRMADVIGADFRGAKLNRANLTTSIFLIQSQLDSAKGDLDTKLPQSLNHLTIGNRDRRWSGARPAGLVGYSRPLVCSAKGHE